MVPYPLEIRGIVRDTIVPPFPRILAQDKKAMRQI
jgi:hypothetical protein